MGFLEPMDGTCKAVNFKSEEVNYIHYSTWLPKHICLSTEKRLVCPWHTVRNIQFKKKADIVPVSKRSSILFRLTLGKCLLIVRKNVSRSGM